VHHAVAQLRILGFAGGVQLNTNSEIGHE
jgi:hypothetical protein